MLQIRVTLITLTSKVGQKKDPGILECFLIVNILSLSDEKPILSFETRTRIVFKYDKRGKKTWAILNVKEKCTVSGQSGQGLIWRIGNWQTTGACVESTAARLITFLLSSLVDFSPHKTNICFFSSFFLAPPPLLSSLVFVHCAFGEFVIGRLGLVESTAAGVDHFLEFLLSSF